MTDKPNHKQIQQACDLLNGPNDATPWFPSHYGACTVITALADTIAKLDAMQAERDKARADLGEIDRIALHAGWDKACHIAAGKLLAVATIAAPYRVETDPNELALAAILQAAYGKPGGYVSTIDEWKSSCNFTAGVAELAKRGLEIGRSA